MTFRAFFTCFLRNTLFLYPQETLTEKSFHYPAENTFNFPGVNSDSSEKTGAYTGQSCIFVFYEFFFPGKTVLGL